MANWTTVKKRLGVDKTTKSGIVLDMFLEITDERDHLKTEIEALQKKLNDTEFFSAPGLIKFKYIGPKFSAGIVDHKNRLIHPAKINDAKVAELIAENPNWNSYFQEI